MSSNPSGKKFQTRLCCDNCGHDDVYEIPKRRRIISYEAAGSHTEGDPVLSSYERMNGTDHQVLLCYYCDLPCLVQMWWNEQVDAVVMQEQDNE